MTELLPTVYLPLIAVFLYAVFMWLYRRWTAGETFDVQKLLQALGLGAVATLALYFANGTIPGVDLVLQYMTQYAGNNGTLTAIMTVLWALIDQYLIKGKATGTPLVSSVSGVITTEQTKSTLTGTNAGPSPLAEVSVLGIYGNSALSAPPAAEFTCDVNQVPQMFFNMQGLVTGRGVYSMTIDGNPLKDCELENFTIEKVGQVLPLSFWIPQKYRTTSRHIIGIKTGVEVYETPGANDAKKTVIRWLTAQSFGLTFTGIKAAD